jgi:hypothetical protein
VKQAVAKRSLVANPDTSFFMAVKLSVKLVLMFASHDGIFVM